MKSVGGVAVAADITLPASGVEEELAGYLWFTAGGENYAVTIGRVKEVIRPRRVTPVPGAPAAIMGILSQRGAIIPILDLSERLGFPTSSTATSRRIIVVRKGEGGCGLLVNRVGRVVMEPASNLEPVPGELPATERKFISGAIRYKGALLLLLDLDRLLDPGTGLSPEAG